MGERLISVGIDVGTTTTQLIVSRLEVQNRASAFTVPEMVIGDREVIYRSAVHFTPLLGIDRVDGQQIRRLVEQEYANAGISREDVDTGAIIITGETSRKENAQTVLEALSGFAGDFVVATAGPDLESVLAARGAGAVDYSADTGKSVLHMDIGGGTSNLAWIVDGKILTTGCMNVGGRLIKVDDQGMITYLSPVLEGICHKKVGQILTEADARQVSEILVQALEMAAGLRQRTALFDALWTKESQGDWPALAHDGVISFSGGVADCIENDRSGERFGDIGPVLGRAIRESKLCQKQYRLGDETIRATVIGAGCHSLQLSGSTVFWQNITLPLKNLPVICLSAAEQALSEEALAALIRGRLARLDGDAFLAMPGLPAPRYHEIKRLAKAIEAGFADRKILVVTATDMAKALGQRLALTGQMRQILCIDRVAVTEESFLDVGANVGPALPVVIKTLILAHSRR